MRILKISDVYFPRINGVSTSIRSFANEFQALGHEVTLIAPEYPQAADDSFEVIRIPSRYLPVDPEDRVMHIAAIKRLLPELKQREFDLIHIHTPFIAHYLGLWLGKHLNLPVVESYHTYFEEYLEQYLPWIPRRLLRLAARRFSRSQCHAVDTLVVPTAPMLEVLKAYGISEAKTAVIPTGIPGDAFTGGQGLVFRQRHDILATREVLVYVGRVAHEKNIGFLLDVLAHAIKTRPDLLLVIAGEGPARASLMKRVKHSGLENNVLFVGYLSRKQELADCYAAGDAFVFASNTETQGLVLLEAMQAGTPVVTTAVMGTAEIMQDGRGGLVAKENVEDFADKIDLLLTDNELRNRLVEEAHDKARAWNACAMAHRMLGMYATLTSQTPAEDTTTCSDHV